MGNFFGIRRRTPSPTQRNVVQVTPHDRAVLQLKQQRDKIKIYQRRTQQDLEKNKNLAIELFQKGYKDRAVIVLKRKKCMEEILLRTDRQLDTLWNLVNDIEYTQIEVSVVEGLKVGTEALKQLNSLMNIDDIQQMMDENAEAAQKQKEITQILQQSSERFNDDEITKELEDIIQSQTEPQQDVQTIIKQLPSPPEEVPTGPEPVEEATGTRDEIVNLDQLPDVAQGQPESHGEETRAKTKQRETRQLEPAS